MKSMKIVSTAVVLSAAFASFSAKADMVTDAHGNVGYDTEAECDAAIANGSAHFYQPFTHKAPLKRKGEAGVQTATLKDLGEQYSRGACDAGVGRRMGRDGVSTALQGKFIPFSPDMPVNVYTDKAGNAVRVTMAQCDNWFSGAAPRPAAAVAATTTAPVNTYSQPDVSVTETVAPAAVATGFAAKPYVFGTLGALDAGVYGNRTINNLTGVADDRDTRFAGQAGFGVQFNDLLGAELFYTGSVPHKFDTTVDISSLYPEAQLAAAGVNGVQHYSTKTEQHTYGGRLTLGHNLTDKFRVFGKGGVAGTTMKIKDVSGGQGSNIEQVNAALNNLHDNVKDRLENRRGSFVRGTAGVGATYHVTDKLAVRGDYDHYFKKKYTYHGQEYTAKGKNYVGVGVQYNFR